MRINKDVIRDIFYKLYFYLPYISDDKPSYKNKFADFLRCYGISGVTAEIKYSSSEIEKFSKIFFPDATSVDVSLTLNGYQQDIDMSEKKVSEVFRKALQEIYDSYPDVYSVVNEYWVQHSEELMFLITKRNNVENQSIKQEVQKNLSEFNDNALRFINELIQNADDCIYSGEFNTFTMIFDEMTNEIIISYPEDGFTYADIISLSSINETNKMMNFEKATSTIGEKGRGFKSIFVYFKEVEIESGGYHFKYNIDEASIFQPIYLERTENSTGTRLSLRLKDKIVLSGDDEEDARKIDADINRLILDVKNFYGADNPENLFRNNSIFFTRHFTELCIVFKGNCKSDLIKITNSHFLCDVDSNQTIWWDNPDEETKHVCEGYMEYAALEQIDNGELEEYLYSKIVPIYRINLVGMVKYPNYTAKLVKDRYGKSSEVSINQISKTMPVIVFGIKDIEGGRM